jgi:hypothetical protein
MFDQLHPESKYFSGLVRPRVEMALELCCHSHQIFVLDCDEVSQVIGDESMIGWVMLFC